MIVKKYISKNKLRSLINNEPNRQLDFIVVIPCYNEPDILSTLESLQNCQINQLTIEVIVVINHSEVSEKEIISQNTKTHQQINEWSKIYSSEHLKFYTIGPVSFEKKWAGVGLARKLGMDEAVVRFDKVKNHNGVIISLDADTVVDQNYFTAIDRFFRNHPKCVGATIKFKHRNEELTPKHKKGIELYEKYMQYYKNAVAYTGYPYAMFTVGSAFAVTAIAYAKRGGMNRRQAGEDFYFLQNLAHIGEIGQINDTTVYPSARVSERVPFGTGPILQKWLNGEEDLTLTYNFVAFNDLKSLFDIKEEFYKIDKLQFDKIIENLNNPLSNYLDESNFFKIIDNLNRSCSNIESFNKRFYHQFNAFQILKYLNFVHPSFYKKADLNEQIYLLNQKD